MLAAATFAIRAIIVEEPTAEFSWTLKIESAPGHAPVEVFLGDTSIGLTPISLEFDENDPRIPEVEPLGKKRNSTEIANRLGLGGSNPGYPNAEVIVPPGVTPLPHVALGGTTRLIGWPEPGLYGDWASLVLSTADGVGDHCLAFIVTDGVNGGSVGFTLRARRGDESVLAPSVTCEAVFRPDFFWLPRHHVEHGTLIVTYGGHYDRATIAAQNDITSWAPPPRP